MKKRVNKFLVCTTKKEQSQFGSVKTFIDTKELVIVKEVNNLSETTVLMILRTIL